MLNPRVFSGAMVLVLCSFILSGCGQGTGTSTTGGGTTGAAAAGEDTLTKIKKAGVIKWGADSGGGAPYVYGDLKDPNHIIGFEMDMMDKIAEHMGVKHERVQAEWASLLENMKAKRTDIVLNGIEINELRLKTYLFSQPYFKYEQQWSVRAADKDVLKSMDDLKDKKIGILDGTEAGNVLKRAGFKEDQIKIYPDSKTPYDDLKIKRVDAILAESIIADFYAGKDKEIFNNPATLAPGIYGVALRKEKESDTLLAEIDRVLKLMKENGDLAAIYKKWNIWNDKQKELGIVEK